MHHLLLLLLMASLAVPPVLSQNYKSFKKQHTYRGNTLVQCTWKMNEILSALNKRCKVCNTFILGDRIFNTNLTDVQKVCTKRGGVYKGKTNMGGDLYESKKHFRVVTCRRDNNKPILQPPNCTYVGVVKKDMENKKITIACEKGLPVHFQGC